MPPWLLFCCLLCSAPLQAAEIILGSVEDNPAIRAFSAALAERRPQDRVQFQPIEQLPSPEQIPTDTRLILLGAAALDWRLASPEGPPTLVLRISRVQAHERLGETRPTRLTLLWSDPAPARQLRLTRLLLPQAQRIGVLYGEHSEFLLDELRRAAAPLGLEIVDQAWPDSRDNRPLQALLRRSDLLFGLNDAELYNPQTAKSLLLTSYAQQRALIGPNASFVRAGSLASSYSDQDDWLASLGQLLDQPPASWPRSTYPSHFRVLGNRQVARALALELADDASLAQQVAEGEQP
ncbi:ABC transporter substrate-binding protein [Pseudomonas sp. sp1636]|uniref:ABC transporter substrate-binding protein n=1 Tax=Pseudomonas sp. sp1636 TaxID=3036707 RepID=UPI0025A572EF|nr:ABC transporter substrate-binding protein [Pseudomonas sp. sp1636]MDM8349881.1 ABC transporter substrate-binding protein [Pseudomonas sp. sp1636]